MRLNEAESAIVRKICFFLSNDLCGRSIAHIPCICARRGARHHPFRHLIPLTYYAFDVNSRKIRRQIIFNNIQQLSFDKKVVFRGFYDAFMRRAPETRTKVDLYAVNGMANGYRTPNNRINSNVRI